MTVRKSIQLCACNIYLVHFSSQVIMQTLSTTAKLKRTFYRINVVSLAKRRNLLKTKFKGRFFKIVQTNSYKIICNNQTQVFLGTRYIRTSLRSHCDTRLCNVVNLYSLGYVQHSSQLQHLSHQGSPSFGLPVTGPLRAAPAASPPASSCFNNRNSAAASRIRLNSMQNACTSMNNSCKSVVF